MELATWIGVLLHIIPPAALGACVGCQLGRGTVVLTRNDDFRRQKLRRSV